MKMQKTIVGGEEVWGEADEIPVPPKALAVGARPPIPVAPAVAANPTPAPQAPVPIVPASKPELPVKTAAPPSKANNRLTYRLKHFRVYVEDWERNSPVGELEHDYERAWLWSWCVAAFRNGGVLPGKPDELYRLAQVTSVDKRTFRKRYKDVLSICFDVTGEEFKHTARMSDQEDLEQQYQKGIARVLQMIALNKKRGTASSFDIPVEDGPIQ